MKIPEVVMGGHTYPNVEVVFSTYQRGGVAIQLYDEDGPLGTASVYMDGNEPSPGCVWIKDWSENEGILESLTKAKVIEPTGRTIQAGYAVAHEARLLVDPEFGGAM